MLPLLNEQFNPYLRDITEEDLQVIVRNSDGSCYVTNGTLLDSRWANPTSSGSSSSGGSSSGSASGSTETQEPAEEEPAEEEPVLPEDGGTGDGTTDPGRETARPPIPVPVTEQQTPARGWFRNRSGDGGTDTDPDAGGGTPTDPGQGTARSPIRGRTPAPAAPQRTREPGPSLNCRRSPPCRIRRPVGQTPPLPRAVERRPPVRPAGSKKQHSWKG